jgi:hypothetical protein
MAARMMLNTVRTKSQAQSLSSGRTNPAPTLRLKCEHAHFSLRNNIHFRHDVYRSGLRVCCAAIGGGFMSEDRPMSETKVVNCNVSLLKDLDNGKNCSGEAAAAIRYLEQRVAELETAMAETFMVDYLLAAGYLVEKK